MSDDFDLTDFPPDPVAEKGHRLFLELIKQAKVFEAKDPEWMAFAFINIAQGHTLDEIDYAWELLNDLVNK